jgi:PBP1b-binding outer membrane lipoprotein LpoB
MKRATLIGLLAVFTLVACAGSSATKYSYTPKTQVTVKGGKKKNVQANYQLSPEESRLGSGGSEK